MTKLMERAEKTESSGSKDAYKTPPPKIPAPSPKAAVKKGGPPLAPPAPSVPETEGARLGRLRRLCEIKPSGKCKVPDNIHKMWKDGSKLDREAMIDELERAGWSQDGC